MSCLPKAKPFAGRDRMNVARHPYVAAVILHGVLFAVIGFYTIGSHATKSDADPPSAAATTSSASANGGFTSEDPPFATSQLQAKISSSLTLAERLTPDQKFSAAGDYASQLEALSSVTTMKEMGAYLGS